MPRPSTSFDTADSVAVVNIENQNLPAESGGDVEAHGELSLKRIKARSQADSEKRRLGIAQAVIAAWVGFIFIGFLADLAFDSAHAAGNLFSRMSGPVGAVFGWLFGSSVKDKPPS